MLENRDPLHGKFSPMKNFFMERSSHVYPPLPGAKQFFMIDEISIYKNRLVPVI